MWLLDGIAEVPSNDARVADLTLDSRQARTGSLFFALAGQTAHGLQFAADAVARGATVVLWEPQGGVEAPELPDHVFAAPVSNLRGLLGRIADRFFGWPSQHLRVIGITGTNGKTTCAFVLAQALEKLGNAAAYIGTIGIGRPDKALEEPSHTTPDVITVHRLLARLRAEGVRDVAMEVSSHALDQERVAGVRFHTAAFTNLTRDHLDYHKTMAAYGEAKAKLLLRTELHHLVINVGDEFGRKFAESYSGRVPMTAVWIGNSVTAWSTERSLCVTRVDADRTGISLVIEGSFGKAEAATQLIGRFNAENSIVVIGCLMALGASLADAAKALQSCRPAPGRMELIEAAAGKPTAVVDYAHTPDSLSKALRAAREHCEGALWCVFGCGGDRDPGKRPIMGGIAEELADEIILTDDNPRSENPAAIIKDIAAGIKARRARVIHDRSEAIGTAIREAQGRDLVLIAGKGHEDYQIYGSTRRSFNDRQVAQQYLGAAA
jgi:UDP-N-acetylmuramoyl-L-alanyl-D-glutamate--2,6-diaminopimelate ligase